MKDVDFDFLKRAEQLPIRIGSQIYRIWMVLDMEALTEESILDQDEKKLDLGCPYGATLWPSTRAFGDWVETRLSVDNKFLKRFDRAIELGCGVGVASCILAKHGIQNVLATDGVANLASLIEKNKQQFCVEETVHFEVLKWGDKERCIELGTFPLVVAFDVLYEPEHIRDIPKTVHRLVAGDGLFILGDPRRFCFDSLVEELKKYFARVEMTTVPIEHESADPVQGLLRREIEFTNVEILLCSEKILGV